MFLQDLVVQLNGFTFYIIETHFFFTLWPCFFKMQNQLNICYKQIQDLYQQLRSKNEEKKFWSNFFPSKLSADQRFQVLQSLQSLLVRLYHSYSIILKIRVLFLLSPHNSGKVLGGKVHFLQLARENDSIFHDYFCLIILLIL